MVDLGLSSLSSADNFLTFGSVEFESLDIFLGETRRDFELPLFFIRDRSEGVSLGSVGGSRGLSTKIGAGSSRCLGGVWSACFGSRSVNKICKISKIPFGWNKSRTRPLFPNRIPNSFVSSGCGSDPSPRFLGEVPGVSGKSCTTSTN